MSNFLAEGDTLTLDKSKLFKLLLEQKGIQNYQMSSITRREKHSPCVLSFAQKRLWFLDQLERNSAAYNVPAAIRFRGTVDLKALERSLNEIVRRHESLRTSFSIEDDQPVQVIAEANSAAVMIPIVDISLLEPKARKQKGNRLIL